jgi:hypothetical protein
VGGALIQYAPFPMYLSFWVLAAVIASSLVPAWFLARHTPDEACTFDLEPKAARVSRRTVLSAAAQAGDTLLPAHFAGHGGASIATQEATDFEVNQ